MRTLDLDLTGSFCAELNVVFALEKGAMSAFGQKRTLAALRQATCA